MRFVITLSFFALLAGSPKMVVANEFPPEKIVTAVYGMPAGMIFESSGPTESRANVPLQPGVKLLSHPKNSPFGKVYDVKGWLEAMGLVFPKEGEAHYFLNQSMLVVRNTEENLISFFNSIRGLDGEAFPILQNEITLVALDRPSGRLRHPTPSFLDLKKSAGSSWREIITTHVLSKSGQLVRTTAVTGQEPITNALENNEIEAPDLPLGAEGNTCAMEVIVGPDGQTIDANLSFRLRSLLPGSKEPLTIRFDGSTTLQDGYPQVLQLIEPSQKGPAYALVLRVTRVLPATSKPLKAAE